MQQWCTSLHSISAGHSIQSFLSRISILALKQFKSIVAHCAHHSHVYMAYAYSIQNTNPSPKGVSKKRWHRASVADLGGTGSDPPIPKEIFRFLPAEKAQKWADTTSNKVQNTCFDHDRPPLPVEAPPIIKILDPPHPRTPAFEFCLQ
jgi:hypothetical protein